jgi:hypothetical protein
MMGKCDLHFVRPNGHAKTKPRGKFEIKELVYHTWAQTDKGERIVRETFFYDPAQMRTTQSTNIAV